MRRRCIRSALIFAAATIASRADAQVETITGSFDEPEHHDAPSAPRSYAFELGADLGYATAPIRGGTNPFGASIGARAGFAFSHFYLGAALTYYFGGSDIDLSDRALLFGAEGGYDFVVVRSQTRSLIIRPQVGIGAAFISHTDPSLADVVSGASSSSGSDTITVSSVYVQPGVTAIFAFDIYFLALNANMAVLPSINYGGSDQATTWISFGTRGSVGLRF
jgi:hypothetical protein